MTVQAESSVQLTPKPICRARSYSHTVHPKERADVDYHVFHMCRREPHNPDVGEAHRCACGHVWIRPKRSPDER